MATTPIETPASPLLTAGDWHVDPRRSDVTFHTRALFGLLPVHGRFDGYDGVLHVAPDGTASGELRIETKTIDTGTAKRDAHLRTADFFFADEHPEMTFALTAIAPAAGGAPTLTGTLTIRDAVLPVSAPVAITALGDDVRLETELTVDHAAAGLGWAKTGMVRKRVRAAVIVTLSRTR